MALALEHTIRTRIRRAEPADVFLIVSFIRELAAYEGLENQVKATPELIEKSLFSDGGQSHCLIAEYDNQAIGFAFFFFNFSTFMGRQGLYLEDLYVRPQFRSRGIGFSLLQELARIAKNKNCARMEWSVLKWNTKAIAFYQKLGAKAMGDWCVYRLETDAIRSLADYSPLSSLTGDASRSDDIEMI